MKIARILAAAGALTVPTYAADVLFVDSDAGLDSSWQALIESGGHTFTLYTGDYNPNTQTEIDDIQNNYDVIVISGSNAAFNSVRANGANWESLTTPILQLSNYLITGQFQSASWQWTTPTTGTTGSVDGALNVQDPSSLLFTGVTLNAGSPQTTNDLFDGTAGTLLLGTDSLLPGISLIAYDAVGEVAIAHASGIFGADHIFLAGGTGGNGQAEPYNAEGETVFLNAIGVLSGELGGGGVDPVITSFSVDTGAGEATINFTGKPNTTYTCKSSTDLTSFPTTETAINSTSFTTGADTGDGTGTGTADVAISGPRRFYRLEE